MSTDERLIAVLAATGHYNADGVGRGARPDTCPDCGKRTLVGLDSDMCALPARVDPHEIDAIGEYVALRIGLPTYNLTLGYSTKGTKRWELNPRWISHIEAPRRCAVVATHRCGMQLPRSRSPFPMPTTTRPAPTTAAPPF